MERKKHKLLIVLSTICMLVLMSVPCFASTIIPEEDIVDDMSQGISVLTIYSTSVNWDINNNVIQNGNSITPFAKLNSNDYSIEIDGNTITGTMLTNNIIQNESIRAYQYIQFNTNQLGENTNINYCIADSIYSGFYINVEYNNLTWESFNDDNIFLLYEPSIKIKYSLSGNTEARLIELENVRKVNISEEIKIDIDETYNNVEEYNVYIWGIETQVYSNHSSEKTLEISQTLIIDTDILKMNKDNSRNTDLIAHGEYVMEEYNRSFENITRDWTSWLGTAIGGFMSFEIVPYVSIGGIFATLIAIALTSLFIKIFMGG